MEIYADHAATTPMSAAAVEAMSRCMKEEYGNPSSIHARGQRAAALLENARKRIADRIGAAPQELYFTSGGTEADNWAVRGAAQRLKKQNKGHIISSRFEHHAVLHTLQALEKDGFELTLLEVHKDGVIRPEDVRNAFREDTGLVTIMYANNEIGTLQPVEEIGKLCRERGVIFHTDAVQAVGHLPVDVQAEHIDLLSFSAHKFHGPKGVGALYCRRGVHLPVLIEGGAQERGKRGGTENLPGILGMAAALDEAYGQMEDGRRRTMVLRDRLMAELANIPRSHLNGHREKRLPGIVNFCFEGIEGESLLLLLDQAGIRASSGSACTSGSLDPSHVLLALGLPHEIAHGSLRLSLSKHNTKEEIDQIIQAVAAAVKRLRDMSPVWEQLEKGE